MTLLLREYIRELLEAPEAPRDAPFGQWFMGSHREDEEGAINEPNTSIETKIGNQLYKHFSGFSQIPLKSIRLLYSMLQQGWYKDWLEPKRSTYIYRGLRLKNRQLAKLLGHAPNREGDVERVDITVPRRTNQHWTTDKTQGASFAVSGGLDGDYNVLLFAPANNNEFVLNPEAGDLLSNYGAEEEVIPVSDVRVMTIAYYPMQDWKPDDPQVKKLIKTSMPK